MPRKLRATRITLESHAALRSAPRDGCNWQAALDGLAQVPANTMQDTMAGNAVFSVPVKTASTITGIVCEKAAYVSRHWTR